jgi:hypothetical protein
VGAFFDNRWVIGADGEPEYREDDYIGPAFPTRTFNASSSFGIGRNLTAAFLMDHKGGHFIESATSRWMSDAIIQAGEPLHNPDDPNDPFTPGKPVASWCQAPTDVITQLMCEQSWAEIRGNHVHPADNWRLREVSLAYRLPATLANRFGASRATLSVAGRNLWRSQKYIGLETEASYTSRQLSNQSYFDTPLPREFVAQLNVSF